MAERDAAVHAPRALARELVLGLEVEVLLVVGDADARIALVEADPLDPEERAELTHQTPAPPSAAAIAATPPGGVAWRASSSRAA